MRVATLDGAVSSQNFRCLPFFRILVTLPHLRYPHLPPFTTSGADTGSP